MNILKEDWLSPKTEIKEIPEKGKGLFAIKAISKGEPVIIYGGEYTDAKGAEKAKSSGKLVMQWDENLFTVEDRGEGKGYYINHSCDPNTWMEDAFTIVAMKNIKVGEEIRIDYAVFKKITEDYVSKWKCKCGSQLCRGKVTGKDWQINELQKKYKNHFTPVLNKLINKNNNK